MWGIVTYRSRPIRRRPPSGLGDPDELHVAFQSDSGSQVATAVDTDGHYAFNHLDPGGWKVSVSARGYQPWEEHIVLSSGERDRRVDIALESCILRVRVGIDFGDPTLDAGAMLQALSDAGASGWLTVRALVTKDPPPDRLSDTLFAGIEKRATGFVKRSWGLADPGIYACVDSFDLNGDLPVYAAVAVGNRVIQSTRVDSAANEVVFRLTLKQIDAARGGMHFRVVDERGSAPQEPGICILSRSPRATTTTFPPVLAKNGEGRIERLMPGRLGMEIRFPGYAGIRIDTVIESGQDLDLGDIKLEPEITIRGRVLDPNGQPAFARIECVRLSGDRRRESLCRSIGGTCETHADGSFEIPRLGRDEYILRAGHIGWSESGPIRVNTRISSLEDIEIHLRRSTSVAINLVNPPGEIEQILIEDDDRLPVAEKAPFTIEEEESASKRQYAVFELPIGHYTALVTANGQILASRELDVGNGSLVVDLRFD